jgi:tetratricopeptide (TPR) repeat protein
MKATVVETIQSASEALARFDFVTAAKLYKRALKHSPDNGGALLGLGLLLNLTGHHKEALAILQALWNAIQGSSPEAQAKIQNFTRAEILGQIGLALQALQQKADALQILQAAYRIYPAPALAERVRALSGNRIDATPFGKLLAKALRFRGEQELDKAKTAFEQALQINAHSDIAQHGLGDVLRMLGDYQKAMPLLQQAIIMQPSVAEYHNTLGMLVHQRGDAERALVFYRRALEIDPNYASAHCNLGVALKSLNRAEEAAAAYRRALAINPNLAEAHNNLGNLLRLTGDLVGAKTALRQALTLRPNYGDAKQNLAALLEMEKRFGSEPVNGTAIKRELGAVKRTIAAGLPANGSGIGPKLSAKRGVTAKRQPSAGPVPTSQRLSSKISETVPARSSARSGKAKPLKKGTPKSVKKSEPKSVKKGKPKPVRVTAPSPVAHGSQGQRRGRKAVAKKTAVSTSGAARGASSKPVKRR